MPLNILCTSVNKKVPFFAAKATKILLDSCLKLSTTLLETFSPEGDKRSTSKSDRQFKTDLEDFFNTAKCTGYDDDILVIVLQISNKVQGLLVYSILKILVQLHWFY